MSTFKIFLVAVSTAFLIASCGSSTTSTAAIKGLNAPAQIKVI